MVKLDVSLIRFLEDEDFRVLTALEMTMRNHEVAPVALVERIAQLPHGGCKKRIGTLLKHKIIHHENTMYDGYSMTYSAYDFLAMRTFNKRGSVAGVGTRVGCGKESDIILVQDENGNECAMKLQRLGRCSFRSVTRNRDYKGNGRTRHGESWFYLSRLAAQKEYAFMQILYDEGFPVPKPIDQNRHAIVMEYLNATLLNNITEMAEAQKVYERCVALIIRLAEHGLIHGDFNEFNLLVTDDYEVLMIDFPQMVSTDHKNASELFDRDINNLANFFQRRFRLEKVMFPKLTVDVERKGELDRTAFASGCFTRKQQQELETLMLRERQKEADSDDDDEEGEEDEENEEEAETQGEGEQQTRKKKVKFQSLRHTRDAKEDANGEEDEQEEQQEEESAVKDAGAKQKKKKVHDGDGNDDEGEEEDDSEESEEEEENEEDESGVERPRRVPREKTREFNPNINRDGTVDQDYVKERVKKDIKHKDNREFYRTLHRNAQKGRQKRRIQQQLKGANAAAFFD